MTKTWVYTCGIDHGVFLVKGLPGYEFADPTECPCGKPLRQEGDWVADILLGKDTEKAKQEP